MPPLLHLDDRGGAVDSPAVLARPALPEGISDIRPYCVANLKVPGGCIPDTVEADVWGSKVEFVEKTLQSRRTVQRKGKNALKKSRGIEGEDAHKLRLLERLSSSW